MIKLLRCTKINVFSPFLLVGGLFLSLVACDASKEPVSVLDRIKKEGILHVVTYNSPITYFEDRAGKTGFEYQLIKSFAKELGVNLAVEQVNNIDDVYATVADNPLWLGAASLVKNPTRMKQVSFSTPYLNVDTVVVYNKEGMRPTRVEDLLGKSLLVIKGSDQADQLKSLKEQYPNIAYQESDSVDVTDLLQSLEENKAGVALVSSNALAMTQVYYPNVRVGFTLKQNLEVSWVVAETKDDQSLLTEVNEFLDKSKQNGLITALNNRFFGHLDVLGYVGAYSFAQHLQERLPKYEKYFAAYGKQYNLDWKLLAAIGYQESHWDPSAVSPTGVRGLMMLTQNTATAMGVKNRLEAEQSIMGAAKLFDLLKQSLSDDIKDPDRIFFALAAYNMGQGHLADVQKIAEMNSLDPNAWHNINKVLPLISQKQWYKQVRYGYARGFETKQFVRNVRRYYDILNWLNYSQRENNTIQPDIYVPTISRNEISNRRLL